MKKIFITLDEIDQFLVIMETYLIITILIAWPLLTINNIHPTELSDSICYFYYYGYFCPGCGGTRAFENMLYGHFLKSFFYHPIVLFVLGLLLISYISYIVYFITRGNVFFFKLRAKHMNYILFIIMFWFFLRNFIAFFFNYNIYNLLN